MPHYRSLKLLSLGLIALVAVAGGLTAAAIWSNPSAQTRSEASEASPDIILGLTAEAKESLQDSEQAFPEDDAGFATYYKFSDDTLNRKAKVEVDNHIFAPIAKGAVSWRAKEADLVAMGDNYTVARLHLLNIDDIRSTVNLYYDDEGWIVGYLSEGEPSSQIWQSREADTENPALTDEDLANTLLLDAINVVVDGALNEEAIKPDAEGIGHYHFQHPEANSFLMLAAARGDEGVYPISFTVPETLDVKEVSATLWITEDANQEAPCAKIVFNESALIEEKCAKGIYTQASDLAAFNEGKGHSMKLHQMKKNNGASGGLMMIVYARP